MVLSLSCIQTTYIHTYIPTCLITVGRSYSKARQGSLLARHLYASNRPGAGPERVLTPLLQGYPLPLPLCLPPPPPGSILPLPQPLPLPLPTSFFPFLQGRTVISHERSDRQRLSTPRRQDERVCAAGVFSVPYVIERGMWTHFEGQPSLWARPSSQMPKMAGRR